MNRVRNFPIDAKKLFSKLLHLASQKLRQILKLWFDAKRFWLDKFPVHVKIMMKLFYCFILFGLLIDHLIEWYPDKRHVPKSWFCSARAFPPTFISTLTFLLKHSVTFSVITCAQCRERFIFVFIFFNLSFVDFIHECVYSYNEKIFLRFVMENLTKKESFFGTMKIKFSYSFSDS